MLLVAGGAGFIGSAFVRRAITAWQARVVVLDKLTYAGNLDSLQPVADDCNYQFVQGDINDRDLVRELLDSHQPDAVLNFAAESHVDRSIDGPREFLETNVFGTFTLLAAALDHYGSAGPEPPRAVSLPARLDGRGVRLAGPERQIHRGNPLTRRIRRTRRPRPPRITSCGRITHTYGLPVLITNCSNNYGPYQFPEKLIPLMILNALEGEPLPVYGDGQNVRDWLYVEDHCRAIWQVLESRPPRRNLQHRRRLRADATSTWCGRIAAIVDELCPGLPHAPANR